MKKHRIVLCLLIFWIFTLMGGGCSMRTNKVAPIQSTNIDSSVATDQVAASATIHRVNNEKEELSNEASYDAFADATGEMADVNENQQEALGTGTISDMDTQQILFGGGQIKGQKTPSEEEDAAVDILLNFDDAELSEVIRELADSLKINYMLDSAVNGKVTIHSAVPIGKKQLFPVFLQILDANGLTAIQVGELYQIGKSKDAAKMPLLSRIGRSTDGVGAGQKIIMQIVPLKHISSQQMVKVLTPFISSDGMLVDYDETNAIILVDKEINIHKALKLVEVFDVDVFEKTNHAIYRLENIDAKETVKVVQELISASGSDFQKETKIISVDRLNALIVFSKKQKIFDVVESFLKTLDIPTYNVEPQIYVYSVRNGRADELSELLGTVFSTVDSSTKKKAAVDSETKSEAQAEMGNPFEIPSVKGKKGENSFAGSSAGSGSLKGEVKITADEIRNSLIIEAMPSDYLIIEKILNKLDVLPRQVLIEVTIAEVTLTDNFGLGLEWKYWDSDYAASKTGTSIAVNKGLPGTSVISAAITGDSGLTYLIGAAERWEQKLEAKAEKGEVNIISSPSVLASDNKEATINISTELPVVSSVYNTTNGDSDTVTTNVQYRNTGVILTVTPHINEFGLVSMDISQEVSEATTGKDIGGVTYPAFFKRSVKTTLTVNDQQTIVIGGLIKEDNEKNDSGVPILKDIPLLKYLFSKVSDDKTKSELILLITPRVIINLEDVDMVTEEFKSKLNGIERYSPQQ